MNPRPAFQYLAEGDEDEHVSGGLNHLVPRNVGGAQLTWKKVTVCSRRGGGGARDAEEHVPRNIHEETKRSKNGKRFKGPGGSTSRIMGSKSSPSDLLKDSFVRKSTWQVADVRRPLVSASHIMQAGNDLFIGKDDECINEQEEEGEICAQK